MERVFKHTMSIVFEVESTNIEMPTNGEIASALYQKRNEDNLPDQVQKLDVEEVIQTRHFTFDPPIEFGGHKKAVGLSLKLPIYEWSAVSMRINYINEGTEKEYHQPLRRRLYTKTFLKSKRMREMTFKFQNTEFSLMINEDDVVERQKFSFNE